jgi:hypothetical protein
LVRRGHRRACLSLLGKGVYYKTTKLQNYKASVAVSELVTRK